MHEIELKFQVPEARRAAVDAAVAGRARPRRTRLQAAYLDTAERTLAEAGLALRLRREGRQWVQTLKGGTADAMTRSEHNVARGGAAVAPGVDIALHAGTPVGDRLQSMLAEAGAAKLSVLYRTDITRRTRTLRSANGRVELAFDVGSIDAGDATLVVCELEVELLAGSPLAVLDTARRWVPRFGLWLDTRSKAERGDLLARGEPVAPPRQAMAFELRAEMSVAMAWRTVLTSCADQIIANASQVASGRHGAEHVHQLRVGLRRLRSALSLFEGIADDAGMSAAAAKLFRQLGSARDTAVIEGEFADELRAALRSAGVSGDAPAAPAPADEASPTHALRETGSQMLLLDLLAAAHADAAAAATDAPAWRAVLARRLNRWHRQLVADLARFAELDDAARHQLRKRAKRLRYATEFCGTLFERRAVRRYLKALRALQERLGALSDVVMAMQAFARHIETDPRAMFALGWLAARRELLIRASTPEAKAFGKTKRFWKKD